MCSTTYGDLVCRGCRRFSHEIVNWNRYGDVEKRAVWARLNALKEQVVLGRIEVVDAKLLDERLRAHRIPFAEDDSAAVRAYELLRRGARHMRRLEAYGLQAHHDYAALDPPALRDLVDRDLLALAEAHYERYVAVEHRRTGS
jgi:predicted Fe-S protein YdhL (DUF1289 family)